MDTKKYLLYGGASVVILMIGVAIGSFVVNKGGATPSGEANTYQAGWDAAKKRLSETGYAFPSMPEVSSVAGSVEEVHSGGMTVKIRPLEPLADPVLDTRTVKFDANTTFFKIEQKDPAKYREEVKAFNLKMKANPSAFPATPGASLEPFTKTTITADAIKSGMTVSVTAGGNIKDVKEFIAKEVIVQVIAAPIAAPVVPPTIPR